jgi:hypothetical protein
VNITSPHFNEIGIELLQRFKLFPAQEADRGQFLHDGETLASLATGSFSWLQGVIPPWKKKPKLFFPRVKGGMMAQTSHIHTSLPRFISLNPHN